MVRMYNYSIPQNEVLPVCQQALSKLGYEVEIYAPLDNHLVTETRIVKKLLRRIHYVVYVKVEDRIAVYVYAETRTFKRASELGIMAGDLTQLEASENLVLGFQNEIFDPISVEFEDRGFKFWDASSASRRDDQEIRVAENRRERELLTQQKNTEKQERTQKQLQVTEYALQRDLARFEAVREAEHYVGILYDSVDHAGRFPRLEDWSLIEISKTVVMNDDNLRQALLTVLDEYRSYQGRGTIEWIVDPDGRIVHVQVHIDTSPYTPEMEISQTITSLFRRMVFLPSKPRFGYLVLTREFEFSGSYHNLKHHFGRPRILALLEDYPPVEKETVSDTLFDTRSARER